MNTEEIKRIIRQMHRESSAEMAQGIRLGDTVQMRMARDLGNWATKLECAVQ